jgi:hypothetical protein
LLPTAFDNAEATNRCIPLRSGSYVTDVSAPGGVRTLEVNSAGRYVKFSLPDGGSASQLDMWTLKLNKVRAQC